jgi:hypothetical protein
VSARVTKAPARRLVFEDCSHLQKSVTDRGNVVVRSEVAIALTDPDEWAHAHLRTIKQLPLAAAGGTPNDGSHLIDDLGRHDLANRQKAPLMRDELVDASSSERAVGRRLI